ncbi:hypothetical protein AMIS_30530 [Actinoplanes missouriensis 431]|uniref:Cardiolipin synthase N-terminal domain-containing protein n=1 Tax=Actinoplanes missouriensis (strain ATCC 14538 / DSM 43046 / CBS 188.64 / JCM 3121 / NBRC 102363 / NCIMB 12654 / NRRL B-3342 / UNCC 431) TaxID=512565 RepID=I0H5I6_ACTM4|nr:hypothetical protein [Actinoplanes missouriensis]BAL88273.1 hypothetical protein AMIS_30530 [Actinoplanes missouriensis 431]
MTENGTLLHPIAAADLAPTLTGIAFWTVLLAAYVALFVATLVSVCRAPLDAQARTRWVWFVVLAPGLGIALWFAKRP